MFCTPHPLLSARMEEVARGLKFQFSVAVNCLFISTCLGLSRSGSLFLYFSVYASSAGWHYPELAMCHGLMDSGVLLHWWLDMPWSGRWAGKRGDWGSDSAQRVAQTRAFRLVTGITNLSAPLGNLGKDMGLEFRMGVGVGHQAVRMDNLSWKACKYGNSNYMYQILCGASKYRINPNNRFCFL